MMLKYAQGTTILFHVRLPENTPAGSDFYVTIGQGCNYPKIRIAKKDMTPEGEREEFYAKQEETMRRLMELPEI